MLLAFAGAVVSVSRVTSLLPPKVEPRDLQVAAASTRVLVDLEETRITDRHARMGDFDSLARRSVLLANLMTSDPVRPYIARHADVPADQIAAVTKVTASAPIALTEPDSERRASDIRVSRAPYRINVQPDRVLPTFNVYAQAPTVAGAEKLADAAMLGLRDYLRELAIGRGIDPEAQVKLQQLGAARGAVVNGGIKIQLAALSFMVVLAISSSLLVLFSRIRRSWASAVRRGRLDHEPAPPPPQPPERDEPVGVSSGGRARALRPRWAPMAGGGAAALRALVPSSALALPAAPTWGESRTRQRVKRLAGQLDDWPRTTRVLPWMLAVFMAVLWLVPFNTIQLAISLPIDLKFDRLFLPFIVAVWLLAIATGGKDAPRIRLTWIHAGVGAFITFACLSLVLNGPALNQTLELDVGIKKLVLIGSYGSLFLIIASSVRRTEVPAFLTYTLALATLCALGTVVEYRFQWNVFYELSDAILPGIFQVGAAEAGAVDDIGRRLVRGPAEVPLEAVAMLAMALPIALSRLLQAERWRERVIYGLAACMFMAASISTYRKSAFVIPISVCLTLAYFRRRELLRLAPLAVVVLIGMQLMSPGAFISIVDQLQGDRLEVATVSDRTSDYDAVRPDLWTNLAAGRGFGTYEHTSYRILDMELLKRLVEGGVLGLAAYIFMIVTIVMVARGPIHRRHPIDAPVGLAGAAAAVAFLVASTLFDVMSFPHCPYIVLCMAGFLAAAVKPPEEP